MPIYSIKGPNGKTYSIEGPAGASREQVIQAIQARLAQQKEPESGIIAGAKRGAEFLVSSGQETLESAFGDKDEAVRRGMQRRQEISEKYAEPASLERAKQAYEERGLLGGAGEVASQVLPTISEQAAPLAAMAASSRLGAMAGTAVGGLPGGIVGGLLGSAAPSFTQAYASNLQRQAQEQIARGEEVDVNRLTAAATAVPQAAIDTAGTAILLGKTLIGKLLGETVENAIKKRGVQAVEKLAAEKLLKTIGKGVAVGGTAEIGGEVTQQMLERLQAGLSLTSEDAIKEYGETAYQTALMAPLGGLGRVAERGAARSEVATRRAVEEAEQEAARVAAAQAAAATGTPPAGGAPPAPTATGTGTPPPPAGGGTSAAPTTPATPARSELEQKALDYIKRTGEHSAIKISGALGVKLPQAGAIRQKLIDSGDIYSVAGEGGKTEWRTRSEVAPEKLSVAVDYLAKFGAGKNSVLDIKRAFKDAGGTVSTAEAAGIRNELISQKFLYKDRDGKWQIKPPTVGATPTEVGTPGTGEPDAGPATGGTEVPVSAVPPAGSTPPPITGEGMVGTEPVSTPPDGGTGTVPPALTATSPRGKITFPSPADVAGVTPEAGVTPPAVTPAASAVLTPSSGETIEEIKAEVKMPPSVKAELVNDKLSPLAQISELAKNADDFAQIKSEPNMNKRRMARMLGPALYGDPTKMGAVTIKEILQNSFDSIKGMIDSKELDRGSIDIAIDPDNRVIEMTDNGRGMAPEILGTRFLEIAGTGKDAKTPSGGFGIAKMLFLYGNEGIKVTTMQNGKVAEMTTTGEQLYDALEDPEVAPIIYVRRPTEKDMGMFPDGHGTYIALTIPKNFENPSTGKIEDIEMVDSSYGVPALHKSPLFSNIDVSFTNKRDAYRQDIYIGSKFPLEEFKEFANVKFPWGNARVYVRPVEYPNFKNMHILSNGLYQFSSKISKNPNSFSSEPVPFEFYVDIKPTVKADQIGYPFTLNRKEFTEIAGKEFVKVTSYINALYAYKDLSEKAASFGSMQYFNWRGKLTAPIEIKPTVPPAKTSFSGIQQGDKVTVEDGKLFVKGKELPELTTEDLKQGIPSANQLKVDPSLIDPDRIMVHDNVTVSDTKQSFSAYMREQHGKAFDDFMYQVGKVFIDLRNDVAKVLGYEDLLKEGVGISIDKEYRGVSIRVPFSGSFINPFATASNNPLEAAYGSFGTMIHELAHFKVRGHDADFPAEMQLIQFKMLATNKKQFDNYQNKLVETFNTYQDVFENGWRLINESGNIEASGDRFEDGSREDRGEPSFDRVPPSQRGSSGARSAQQRVQPSAQQGTGATPQGGSGQSAATPAQVAASPAAPAASPVSGASAAPLRGVAQTINSLPKINSPLIEEFVRKASSFKGPILKNYYGLLSMTQMGELFANVMPSIKTLVSVIERRSSDMMKRREKVSKNYSKWQKIANRYKNVLPNFFRIANESTVEQIDVAAQSSRDLVNRVNSGAISRAQLTPFDQKIYDLTTDFFALPAALQTVYRQLRTSYEAQGDELLNIMKTTINNPALFAQIEAKFRSKRLGVYLPLFRDGDYWLNYTDTAGETVSLAFNDPRQRSQALQALTPAERATAQMQVKGEQLSRKSAPPAGFLKDVLDSMAANGAPPAALDSIYLLYLEHIPAQSLRQQFKPRAGVKGFEKDVLKVYATMAPRMESQLNNMRYATAIDQTMTEIKKEQALNGSDSMGALAALENVKGQIDFIQNPPPRGILDSFSYFSYMWYILGNASSALVNLSQMAIVVYPLLAGKYGHVRAMKEWESSIAQYFAGGWDNNTEFMPDWTFGGARNLDPEFKALFDAAVDQSVIRRSTGQELAEAKVVDTTEFSGKKARVEQGLGWVFQNSERANREVTLLMAYRLARQGTSTIPPKSPAEARKIALEMSDAAHGSALAETGPRLFQTGLGKVMFVFKRFAQSQIYLLTKLFAQAFKGASPEIKSLARRQLGGIFAMAYMVAGVQGMPLYGAAALLASMTEDEDEPRDWDSQVIQWLTMVGYKGPLSVALQADIASRTGFNGLLWRDDAKRMEEIGPVLYAAEVAGGPTYGILRSFERAVKHYGEGNYDRAIEASMPAFVRNGFKAMRLAEEGALTKKGVPIVKELNDWNIFMQTFGFNPLELSEESQRAGAITAGKEKYAKRKASLLNKFDAARMSGDREGMKEIYAEMGEFNKKILAKSGDSSYLIKDSTLQKSYMQRRKQEAASVAGIYLPQKDRQILMDTVGWENDPLENVDKEEEEE